MSNSENNIAKTATQEAGVYTANDLKELSQHTWITDYAWVSGLAGALAVVLCAVWYKTYNTLESGLIIAGYQLTNNPIDTVLAALFICTGIMFIVEMVRVWLHQPGNFLCIAPDLQAGGKGIQQFFASALFNWLLNLALLYLVISFFHTAGEYGFKREDAYYQAWFRFLELVWIAYLWAGLPYVLLTRAFKHDPSADRKDTIALFLKILQFLFCYFTRLSTWRPQFDQRDKKAALALIIKAFFAPLMTVFFYDQFPHLVNNIGYMFHDLPHLIANNNYSHGEFNSDLFHITMSLIFSIDVALAWCGYIISSRWVDNQTASAEPTMLGWAVCLICYPPFQQFFGFYYSTPGDQEVLAFNNQYLTTVFTVMMAMSYVVYMLVTLWFGVRFSNLTNRGIIRKGPFAIVRHPAYASKNFAWWVVMFPAIIYNVVNANNIAAGFETAALQILGLLLLTWIYYLRAITEERHLSADPYYRAYCQEVKYRFIPGVL